MPYKRLSIVDADEVPNWRRRQTKYDDIVEDVIKLSPGKSIPYMFDDIKEAKMARNAVRDRANRRLKSASIRTRVINREDGKVEIFYIKEKPFVNIEKEE